MYKEIEKGDNILSDDLLNSILWFNGIKTTSQYENLINSSFPFSFTNTNKFIEKINNAKINNQKIVIIGDYDVDGICATTILIKFLLRLNIKHDYLIGDRFIDGYGINTNLIDKAIKLNANLIITVDNGINAKDEIKYAIEKGVDIIVTDHHQPNINNTPNTLIFNPHFNQSFDFNEICGAMVILNLIFSYLKSDNALIQSDKAFMFELYELAALATIADVMPLKNINRKVVNQLIKNIRYNNIYNSGLKNILDEIGFNNQLATSIDIGYKVVPILNAPGRLEHAKIAIDALLNDINSIKQCIALNKKRQDLTKSSMTSLIIKNSNVNVLYADNIHEGIIGILAGKVKEMTNKPSFIFTDTNDGIKGSGRSIKGFNLLEAATNVFNNNPDIVIQYGGHTDAMGITLKNLDAFKVFRKEMNKYDTSNLIIDDYYIEYTFQSFESTYNKIEMLSPYGEEFIEPLFHIKGTIENKKILSNSHTSFSINGKSFISFNRVLDDGEYDILFTIKKESYNERLNYKGHIKNIYKSQS